MSIELGQQAPAFSLYDTEKNKVSLDDFKGKPVVLLFFPLAFTSVCTAELCNIRDNMSLYNQWNATVLGISVDSLFVLKKFREEQGLNFPLLSDFNREASKAYGVLYPVFAFEMREVSKRSAFVLDKESVVRYAAVLENAGDLPDFQAIQEVLNGLA